MEIGRVNEEEDERAGAGGGEHLRGDRAVEVEVREEGLRGRVLDAAVMPQRMAPCTDNHGLWLFRFLIFLIIELEEAGLEGEGEGGEGEGVGAVEGGVVVGGFGGGVGEVAG